MSTPTRLAALVLSLVQIGSLGSRAAAQSGELLLRDVALVDVARGERLAGRSILVRDGCIARVAPAGELAPPPGAQVIEGRGLSALPGLVDAHVHLYEEHDLEDLWLYLASGVTTVRSMHGGRYQLGVRARTASGEVVGPRVLTTGPTTAHLRVRTPEQARAVASEQAAAGYDAIKMYGDGSDTMTRETYRALVSAAREAGIPVVGHAPRNMPFSAVLEERPASIDHMEEILYTDEGLARLVKPYVELQFGRRRVEDSAELMAALPDFATELSAEIAALARRVREAGLAVTPTLVTFGTIQDIVDDASYPGLFARDELRYVDAVRMRDWAPGHARFREGGWGKDLAFFARYLDECLELQLALTKAFHDAGVPILTGSDAPFDFVLPGSSLHGELAMLVRAGLSPLDALRAATLVPARVLGLEGGELAEGKLADVVLVDGDPLADVAAARRVEGVVLRGRWLAPEELRARLASIEARTKRLAPILEKILAALDAGDAAAVAEAWKAAGEDRERLAPFVEDRVDAIGRERIGAGELEAALAVMQLNAELFPRSSGAFDGLGEALWKLERIDDAIAAYERALELDPQNRSAQRALERIVEES